MPLLPETITAGGRGRAVLRHVQDRARQRQELTTSRISSVLDNWFVRCVSVDVKGREGLTYWGRVNYENREYLMRVVTNIDTGAIVSAYLDKKGNKGLAGRQVRLLSAKVLARHGGAECL